MTFPADPSQPASPVRRDADTERRLGELAARLVPVACDLVCRVRDDGRDAVAELLGPLTAEEQRALLVVLAAMVPDDRSADELLAWVTWDEHGQPVPAAPRSLEELRAAHTRYARDRARGRTPPDPVVAGERAYQRARKRARRRTAREARQRLASLALPPGRPRPPRPQPPRWAPHPTTTAAGRRNPMMARTGHTMHLMPGPCHFCGGSGDDGAGHTCGVCGGTGTSGGR